MRAKSPKITHTENFPLKLRYIRQWIEIELEMSYFIIMKLDLSINCMCLGFYGRIFYTRKKCDTNTTNVQLELQVKVCRDVKRVGGLIAIAESVGTCSRFSYAESPLYALSM